MPWVEDTDIPRAPTGGQWVEDGPPEPANHEGISIPGSPANMALQMAIQSPPPEAALKPNLPPIKRINQGVMDIPYGIGQLGLHVLPDALRPNALPTPQQFDTTVANRDQQYESDRAANGIKGIDWYRMMGQVIGSAPTMAIAPGGAPTSVGGAMLGGGGMGGVNALTQPVTNIPPGGGYWGQKGTQVATGIGTGALTSGLTYGVGSAIGGRNPAPGDDYSQAVNYLQQRGVTPTMGQLSGKTGAKVEDVMQPFSVYGQQRAIKQLNIAAYNEGAQPVAEAFGEAAPEFNKAGTVGVKKLGDYLSDKFNQVKSNISLPIDDDLMTGLGKVVTETSTPRAQVGQDLQNIITKDILDRVDDNGVLTGTAFKDAESTLTARAADYAKSPLADDRNLAKGIYDSLDTIRQSLAEKNPEYAGKLQALNKGWAILTRIEGAVKANSEGGIVTPAQLSGSVRSMDDSVRHRAFARGEALLQPLADAGRMVLGTNYPNSGTAARMLGMTVATGAPLAAAAAHPVGAAMLGGSSFAYTPILQRLISKLASEHTGELSQVLSGGFKNAAIPAGAGASRFLLGG